MPIIARPPKANNNTNYTDEVASGKLDIIDEELDADFNTLYVGVNRLDNNNFQPQNPADRLAYEKLNLTGKLVPGDFAAGGVVGGIPAQSIDKTQLKINASVWAQGSQLRVDTVQQITATPAVDYLRVQLNQNTRGTALHISGNIMGTIEAPSDHYFTVRMRHSSGDVALIDFVRRVTGTGWGNIPWTVAWDYFLGGVGAGVGFIAAVDVFQQNAATYTGIAIMGGSLVVMEHA